MVLVEPPGALPDVLEDVVDATVESVNRNTRLDLGRTTCKRARSEPQSERKTLEHHCVACRNLVFIDTRLSRSIDPWLTAVMRFTQDTFLPTSALTLMRLTQPNGKH